jgi:hypothetical protein
MGSELMTGYATNGTNPLSRITVGSLEDTGYSVDYSRADPFGAENLNSACLCRRPGLGFLPRKSQGSARGSSGSGQRRNLGSVARLEAIAYGQKVLEEKQQAMSSSLRNGNSKWTYVGDQRVVVMYHDGDKINDIVVTPQGAK